MTKPTALWLLVIMVTAGPRRWVWWPVRDVVSDVIAVRALSPIAYQYRPAFRRAFGEGSFLRIQVAAGIMVTPGLGVWGEPYSAPAGTKRRRPF